MPDETTSRPSDEDLFLRFRDGDEQALTILFERYRERLRGFVRQRLPGAVQRRVSISDVVQETYVAAVAAGDRFEDRGDAAFRRWLFGIATNKARQAMRAQGAQRRAVAREVTVSMRPVTRELLGDGESPSEAAVGAELEARIEAALAELPDHYREVLRLTRTKGMSIGEAAACLGRSREATKKIYGRAMAAFSQAFLGGEEA